MKTHTNRNIIVVNIIGKGKMDDNLEGSSIAAQSARNKQTRNKNRRLGDVIKSVISTFKGNNKESQAEEVSNNKSFSSNLGVRNLNLKHVEDVAIPRAEIVSIPIDIALDEAVKVFRDSGLTRLPVFKGTLDNPIGLLHLKDLCLKYGFNGKLENFRAENMVRPVLFVPPSMAIGVLLSKMQAERKHMALVIDEYGGVDGLVTIEDLIEQVVGEIEDEHDIDEVDLWKLEKPGTYIVQAKAPLEDFESEIGKRLSDDEMDDEIDTLGGLVVMLLGRVPTRNEIVEHSSGAEFVILDADPRRIKRIRVVLPNEGKKLEKLKPN